MGILKIYYSVNDCGDGSAYPSFYDSMELAEWDQENQEQGWGESCTGTVTIKGDNMVCEDVMTAQEYMEERFHWQLDERYCDIGSDEWLEAMELLEDFLYYFGDEVELDDSYKNHITDYAVVKNGKNLGVL